MIESEEEFTCKDHPWAGNIMIKRDRQVKHMCAACFRIKYESSEDIYKA